MRNIRSRKLPGIFFIFLTIFVLTSCASEKKTVDPYRDRSYTTSVAGPKTAQQEKEPVPEKSTQEVIQENIDTGSLVPQKSSPSGDISSDAMLNLLTLINDRIVAYESKIEQWSSLFAMSSGIALDEEQQEKLAFCYDQVKSILAAYEELHQQLIIESSNNAFGASVIEALPSLERKDIAYLESECHQMVSTGMLADTWIAGTRDMLLEEKERELNEKMISGEYLQVIELFNQLPLEEGRYASYDTVYNYAQALLRSGRENDASEVLQDLLRRIREQDQVDREFKLMQLVADIQFGLENFDQAFERYIHIINRYAGLGENIDWARKQQAMISARNSQAIEVKNYAELLKSYLTYNPDRDAFRVYLQAERFINDFPDSSVAPTVNHILFESRDRAETWFAQLLQRINTLKGAKKFQEAVQLIEQLPMHEIPFVKRGELTMLREEFISASYEEQESRRAALEEAMQDVWQNGLDHLSAKEYDQAIEVFSTLLETDYAEPASDKIKEASQLAAQEDRRKAAELFVRASKADDQENKLALLFESRQLLKGILVKYPQSGLVVKAQNNLERIEDEIMSIDPAALSTELETTEDIQRDSLQQSPINSVNGMPFGQ